MKKNSPKTTQSRRGFQFLVWMDGNEFYQASLALKNSEIVKAPYYVCLAFSIELFIKSLDTTEELTPNPNCYGFAGNNLDVNLTAHPRNNRHLLHELFNQLPETVQTNCVKEYAECHARSLINDIEHVSDVFVTYRYRYEAVTSNESKALCVTVLEDIASFFHDYSARAGKIAGAL